MSGKTRIGCTSDRVGCLEVATGTVPERLDMSLTTDVQEVRFDSKRPGPSPASFAIQSSLTARVVLRFSLTRRHSPRQRQCMFVWGKLTPLSCIFRYHFGACLRTQHGSIKSRHIVCHPLPLSYPMKIFSQLATPQAAVYRAHPTLPLALLL